MITLINVDMYALIMSINTSVWLRTSICSPLYGKTKTGWWGSALGVSTVKNNKFYEIKKTALNNEKTLPYTILSLYGSS